LTNDNYNRHMTGGKSRHSRNAANERVEKSGGTNPSAQRLDQWLDVACLFRTRSEAKRACEGGKVDVGGHAAKPNRDIKPGDLIEITHRFGRRQKLVVTALAEQHVPKGEARKLYEDLTPKPTAEELELRRMARMAAPFTRPRSAGTPDRRERRALRRLKEGG
jgi:ribosome-associated heat shock protein Hsp15